MVVTRLRLECRGTVPSRGSWYSRKTHLEFDEVHPHRVVSECWAFDV